VAAASTTSLGSPELSKASKTAIGKASSGHWRVRAMDWPGALAGAPNVREDPCTPAGCKRTNRLLLGLLRVVGPYPHTRGHLASHLAKPFM
jgi:hypothetical protein